MRDTIFQITDSPLDEKQYLEADDFYYHWFTESVADSVDKIPDRGAEIRSFLEELESKKVLVANEDGSFTILPDGKEAYFKDKHCRFVDAAKQVAEVSLNDFAGSFNYDDLVYQIHINYCKTFDTYAAIRGMDVLTFDEFIRGAEIGTPYYFGGVLSYKY